MTAQHVREDVVQMSVRDIQHFPYRGLLAMVCADACRKHIHNKLLKPARAANGVWAREASGRHSLKTNAAQGYRARLSIPGRGVD